MRYILSFLFCITLLAQQVDTGPRYLGSYTVATLPSSTVGAVAVVTDAATAGSCTSGGGSAISLCRYSGSAWVSLSGSGGGSGTVTSVSVTTANGVSGSVATATTTPAITLTLGAITPSSVAAVGTVTGSNLSGTNTGDQTSVSGNAGTATALQTARNINGVSFNGTANITVTADASTLTGSTLNSGVTASSLTSFGSSPTIVTPTIASFTNANHNHSNAAGGGTLAASVIASGTLALARGGTNADLSATGGTSQVLKQTSVGGNISVAQLAASDLSNGTSGTGAVVLASANTGYALQLSGDQANPADSSNYYYGSIPRAISTTADINRVYIPKTGTIKTCYVFFNNSGTLGSSETSTISIRLNNSSDTTVSSAVTNASATTAFNNTSLSISVTAGDYIEMKWATPAWATNPTNVRPAAVVYIE